MKCCIAFLIIVAVLCSWCEYGEAGIMFSANRELDISFDIFVTEKCGADSGVYTKLLTLPLVRCALECATRPKCMAVNHRYQTNTCELLDTDNDTNLLSGHCQYIKNSDITVGNIPCKKCNMLQACDVVQGECVYKECPIPEIPNARVIGYENAVGSSIRVICHRHYRPVNGAIVAQCQKTGKWSQNPKCIRDESAGMDQSGSISNGELLYTGTYFSPAANCTSIKFGIPDAWCMSNCNHVPSHCPPSFCLCEGNQ